VASIIAAGLLVLATTSNAAVAASNAQSIIGQLAQQGASCISGTTTDRSCTQTNTNTNVGNAVSTAAGDPSGSSALSAIGQASSQSDFVQSGTSTTGSGTQTNTNTNQGNAVSTGLP
jgi:hypothetical protein